MKIYVLPNKRENSSMNHWTRCMMGTLPLRGTFSQSQKLKRCGGFFLMSLVLLWQFIWIGNILLHWCYEKKCKKKNQTNEQTKNTFPMFQWVQCPVSTYQGVQTCEKKKIWKNKNGFNVCFQNKANVPITIINCGVCLKLLVSALIHFIGERWKRGLILYQFNVIIWRNGVLS